MRFMMLLKADRRTEAGVLPSGRELESMGTYNQKLIDAGVLLDGAGLQPSSKGAKVIFHGTKPDVVDGPFAETKEIIAGYWMIKCDSLQEAVNWAKQVPFGELPHEGRAPEIEIRQMFELEDFPDVPASVKKMEEEHFSSLRGGKD